MGLFIFESGAGEQSLELGKQVGGAVQVDEVFHAGLLEVEVVHRTLAGGGKGLLQGDVGGVVQLHLELARVDLENTVDHQLALLASSLGVVGHVEVNAGYRLAHSRWAVPIS